MLRRQFLAGALAMPARPNSRSGQHRVYDHHGTPFEIGLQHGKALAAEIRGEADSSLARISGRDAFLERVRARYEGMFREYTPSALEEIRGIAEGAKLPYSYAFYAATRDMMDAGECTAFFSGGEQTRGRAILLGQTKDTEAPLERFRIQRLKYSSGRRAIVLNYPGWIANLCLTSDGVTFTGNSLYAQSAGRGTAPGSLLKRIIFEKPSTAAILEAIRPLRFPNGCIIVADRSGHAVCIEFAAGRKEIRDVSGKAFGHANEILFEPLRQFAAPSQSASSPGRQRRIDELLRTKSGAIDVGSLKQAVADHVGLPLSICRHPSPADEATTNAAFVADLASLRMHIAIGNPCIAPFQAYELPA